MFCFNSLAAAASILRSISKAITSAIVSTTRVGRNRRASLEKTSKIFASHKKASKSLLNAFAMPGRSTFTATFLPSIVLAIWTCAIEAAAIGSISNS